jgi:uncharacterized protein YacL
LVTGLKDSPGKALKPRPGEPDLWSRRINGLDRLQENGGISLGSFIGALIGGFLGLLFSYLFVFPTDILDLKLIEITIGVVVVVIGVYIGITLGSLVDD